MKKESILMVIDAYRKALRLIGYHKYKDDCIDVLRGLHLHFGICRFMVNTPGISHEYDCFYIYLKIKKGIHCTYLHEPPVTCDDAPAIRAALRVRLDFMKTMLSELYPDNQTN